MPFDDYIYDVESYPNVFTVGFLRAETDERWMFEVSFRRNDIVELLAFLNAVKLSNGRLVGFNNVNYDYPIIHMVMQTLPQDVSAQLCYKKTMEIINSGFGDNRHIIWDKKVLIPQVDLFKIHHFDNISRATSLKVMEFNMRSESVEDLPFPPGTPLYPDQIDMLIKYNWHDIDETFKFYQYSRDQISFREELTERYGKNFINASDPKIGSDYFVMELEKADKNACFFYDENSQRQPRQTWRDSINLNDAVFPYIQFEEPEFQRITDWFRSQVITETKGVFKDITCTVAGFKYVFGVGGIHGSVESTTVKADDEYAILDLDVTSYYPALAIKNRVHPAHLGEQFCDIYEHVKDMRTAYTKGTPENAMLKLALNATYGKSNSVYSPFYDPLYTMTITINGQLLLCKLAEQLIKIPDLTMIQINTDGLTIKVPRVHIHLVDTIREWWQQYTLLDLEEVCYSAMFIRDVNNYLAVDEGGAIKRKGAYCYTTPLDGPKSDMDWNQNLSSLVIPKAAEAALVYGKDIREFITNHSDVMDFMIRGKVPRASQLIMVNEGGVETILPNTIRYYVAEDGGFLFRVMPPPHGAEVGTWKRANGVPDPYYYEAVREIRNPDGTIPWDERIHTKNRSTYQERRTALDKGWKVVDCSNMNSFRSDINYEYYIQEAQKLVEPLL